MPPCRRSHHRTLTHVRDGGVSVSVSISLPSLPFFSLSPTSDAKPEPCPAHLYSRAGDPYPTTVPHP
jgi:hypothetical protein